MPRKNVLCAPSVSYLERMLGCVATVSIRGFTSSVRRVFGTLNQSGREYRRGIPLALSASKDDGGTMRDLYLVLAVMLLLVAALWVNLSAAKQIHSARVSASARAAS